MRLMLKDQRVVAFYMRFPATPSTQHPSFDLPQKRVGCHKELSPPTSYAASLAESARPTLTVSDR